MPQVDLSRLFKSTPRSRSSSRPIVHDIVFTWVCWFVRSLVGYGSFVRDAGCGFSKTTTLVFTKFGINVQYLCQMSLLTFWRPMRSSRWKPPYWKSLFQCQQGRGVVQIVMLWKATSLLLALGREGHKTYIHKLATLLRRNFGTSG